jgi:hypothetical protein
MEDTKPTKTIFCAKEQKDTVHVLSLSPANGEVIATCACGEFIKFPAGIKKDEFEKQITAYKQANEGQVSMEKAEKNLQALADLKEK